ncbi:MAG TPA: molecular chaperone TorD family protein [Vicinamibacterales bacterium]|nr:molecular chaperone TorD family protein [Vicinamibacterales bacterium]
MSAQVLDDRVNGLLHDAAAWRLLGRLFECPDASWREDITRLASELQDDGLRAAVAAVGETATEGQYHSVFGPGGPAPPREASYLETLELGSLMSTLAGYYGAFAYDPQLTETPDHVAVEAGFVSYLKLKEAYAYAQGDEARAQVVSDASARFVDDHLAMMAVPLAALLAGSHLDYLAQASSLLAARVGPRRGPMRLTVLQAAPDDDDGSEFTCAL